MIAFQKVDMTEVTRLTRLGRLGDAMALLKGRPLDASPSDVPVEPSPTSSRVVVDMQPPTAPGGAWTAPPSQGSVKEPRAGVSRFARGQRAVQSFDLGGLRRSNGRGSAAPLAAGARFVEATFTNAAGSRAYKLYVPSGYDGHAIPLVVMLHGCTQSPDDFAAGTQMNGLAEEQTFLVAYPAQPQSAHALKCWKWFNVADQRRDGGEPSLIAGITRQVMSGFAVDEGRVFVAGLSAGGAAAAIMGSAYADLYAAIGVHSGLACGAASDMPSALSAMSQGGLAPARRGDLSPVPTIVFHGDKDRTVSPINGDQVIAQSKGGARLRVTQSSGTSRGGVAYRRTVHADENGLPVLEQWQVHGAGHAWFGGSAAGSYTDPKGPDASREMIRFFLQHRLTRSA